MVRGLYTASTGAIVAQSNVDVIANNLANVNTSGFKRTLMQVESEPKMALFRDQIDPGQTGDNRTRGVAVHDSVGYLGFGSRIYDTPTNFEQGPIQQTGNPLDVALSGPGFLSVRNAAGTVAFTRGGSFTQNQLNQLVTSDGDVLMGANGQPLIVQPRPPAPIPPAAAAAAAANGPPPGAPVFGLNIDRQGIVTSNGVPSGQLALSEFANLTNVRPQGANKFVNAGPAPVRATQTTVLQGAQERSNAQVVTSMVGLISNERWFDVNQKMMQTQDAAVALAIETVGKSSAA